MDKDKIEVEVVYALPTQQRVLVVRLPAKSTVAEAIKVSGILDAGDPVGGEQKLEVGIWGKTCALSHLVHAGDRIEIYRPLQITPMDARKLRASNNKKKLR